MGLMVGKSKFHLFDGINVPSKSFGELVEKNLTRHL